MQVTINKKEMNNLMQRTWLQGELEFDKKTPSNKELQGALAKEMKVEDSLLVIKKIDTLFSQRKAVFEAVAYKNKESKDKYEVMTKHLRKKAEEEAKKLAEKKASEAEAKKAAKEAKKAEEVAKVEPVAEPEATEEKKE
ncbi:hypothetical protein HN385_00270 [archaeon]|jgi:ribosomal protein S24E|nr:hypothetical protein [archaeon]MBT3451642.1 hypothetical protein [archaeon]MBT6869663.1 hypothetical protein [archaeon]MBT7192431.1 hypothetical protein [archaeon]MBT7380232.1 hypothetical protein [archaeon]